MQTAQAQTERSSTSAGGNLVAVPSWQVTQWWPLIVHHVERWVEHDGTWSTREVLDELEAARAQLWCFIDGDIVGIWVTRVESTDRCKWGVVWGCAGDLGPYRSRAVELFASIEEWFRSLGCEFVEWSGREGWARVLCDYKKHAIVLRKKL